MTDHRKLLDEMVEHTVKVYGSHAYACGGLSSLLAILIDGLEEPSRKYAMDVIKHLKDAAK